MVGDLTSVITRRDGVLLDSHAYQVDAVGNITQHVANGLTWNYQLDDLSRLTVAEVAGGSPRYDWSYDRAGNRLSQKLTVTGSPTAVTAYQHDLADRLIRVNGQPVSYDANGNVTAYGADTYTWNVRGELVGLTRPALSAVFAYDDLGRRIAKTINGTKTSYLLDGDDIVSEITGTNVAHTLQSPFIDEPIKRDGFYFTGNHLGSTTMLTDGSGSIVERYSYLPFGETWANVGGPLTANPANLFQFTGRENDGTGLIYSRSPVSGGDPVGWRAKEGFGLRTRGIGGER